MKILEQLVQSEFSGQWRLTSLLISTFIVLLLVFSKYFMHTDDSRINIINELFSEPYIVYIFPIFFVFIFSCTELLMLTLRSYTEEYRVLSEKYFNASEILSHISTLDDSKLYQTLASVIQNQESLLDLATGGDHSINTIANHYPSSFYFIRSFLKISSTFLLKSKSREFMLKCISTVESASEKQQIVNFKIIQNSISKIRGRVVTEMICEDLQKLVESLSNLELLLRKSLYVRLALKYLYSILFFMLAVLWISIVIIGNQLLEIEFVTKIVVVLPFLSWLFISLWFNARLSKYKNGINRAIDHFIITKPGTPESEDSEIARICNYDAVLIDEAKVAIKVLEAKMEEIANQFKRSVVTGKKGLLKIDEWFSNSWLELLFG